VLRFPAPWPPTALLGLLCSLALPANAGISLDSIPWADSGFGESDGFFLSGGPVTEGSVVLVQIECRTFRFQGGCLEGGADNAQFAFSEAGPVSILPGAVGTGRSGSAPDASREAAPPAASPARRTWRGKPLRRAARPGLR